MTAILSLHPQLDIALEHGQGCVLTDARGKTYLDCESGVWSANLGHCHPVIDAALKQQCDRLVHCGFRFGVDIVERAARALLDITGMRSGKCVFLSSGSEAVHLAMRIAQLATRRNRWVVLEPSYLAAYGEGDIACSRRWDVIDREAPEPDRGIAWERAAGFVFEPGSAGGRVHFPEAPLVQTIVSRVRENGGLIVAEEVTTGMGRTGACFGFEHYALEPDIVVVGKGLGNGYPVSAVVLSEQVARAVESLDFHYVQSHQNDPLGCAVALAVIQTLRAESLVERSRDLGRRFRDRLLGLQKDCSVIKDVRGRGMMIAVSFHDALRAADVFEDLLAGGVVAGCNPENNLIRFMPPLVITEQQIDRIVAVLQTALVSRA